MLIDTIVTLFVAGFVLIAAYGHILVLQALLAPKDAETPAQSREFTGSFDYQAN